MTPFERGAAWLLNLVEPAGSLRGGSDLRAYYKTVPALLVSGHPAEAQRVLDHVEQRYLRAGGDLDGSGVPWFGLYRTYPHAWLCCGAVLGARFGLARELAGFLAGYHDAATGGFFAGEARVDQEIMTTAMAALACLWSGDHARARAAGGWFERLYAAQPEVTRGLYTTWRAGQLVRETGPDFFVDAAQPRQWYFQYGISAAFLASLAGATGEARWLELARAFVAASQHCGPDRHATPQSGKLGWGAAWTGQTAIAASVAAGLAALQNDDGSWLATGVYGGAGAEADSVTIDVTAEFVTLLGFMAGRTQ